MKIGVRSLLLVAAVGLFLFVSAAIISSRLVKSSWSGAEFAQLADEPVYVDGWLREDAGISLAGFSTVANVVDISFNPTRLAPDGPPRVAVSVCGAEPVKLSIKSWAPHAFAIPAGCSPLTIRFLPLNSFTLKESDGPRVVGTQVTSIKISTSFGFPIVTLEFLSQVYFCLVLLALCAWYAPGRGAAARFSSMVGAVLSAVLLVWFGQVAPDKYLPLYLFCTALLAGMALLTNTPWRESEAKPLSLVWLFVIVALGCALRLYGIDFGLPAHFHPDEVPKVNALQRMVEQHSWNPQYFLHPSLLLYSTYGMNSLLHALGLVSDPFLQSAFLAGRLVSAVAGTLSIALTFEIGRRLFSRNVGLLSAALLAVFPLHITCSRYLKEDALLTFCVLSCVLATIVAVQSNRRWVLLIAGLLAGVTAGTKYSGILLAIVPASAPWLASRTWKPDRRWIGWAIAAVVIAPLGFFATTPYALLDHAKFLKDFAAESRHMQTGHTNTIDPWSQLWMYHFYLSIMPGMTPLIALAAVMGLGYLIRRGRIEDLFIVSVALLFYLPAEYVKAKPAPQPERYIMPCLPFLALALAQFVSVVGRYLNGRVGVLLCSLVILCAPLYRSVQLAYDLNQDTRAQMADWMLANIPKGSKVLMDWKPYCPQVTSQDFVIEHIQRANIIPELDPAILRASGADYLILSSLFYARYFNQPNSNPVLRQRIRDVFDMVPVVSQYKAPSGTYGFHNPVLTLFSLKQEDFARLDRERDLKRLGQIALTSNEARARPVW